MIHSTSWNSFWSWNLYFWNSRYFLSNDAFELLEFWFFFRVRKVVLFFTAYDLFSRINHWKCNKLSKMPWSFIVSINFLFSNPHDLDNSFWICDTFKDSRPVCKYLKIGKLSSPWHCVFWIVTFSVVQSGFIEKSRTQRKHSAHALQLPGGKALKAWYLRICEVLHAII